jgi:hypothetical protein
MEVDPSDPLVKILAMIGDLLGLCLRKPSLEPIAASKIRALLDMIKEGIDNEQKPNREGADNAVTTADAPAHSPGDLLENDLEELPPG